MILSLKNMLILCIVVALVGATVTLALKAVTYKEESTPMEVKTTYGPIELKMGLNQTVYKLGDLVNITLTVTNISNETILLSYLCPPKVDFAVCDKSHQIIYVHSQATYWPDVTVGKILDCGESFSQTFKWSQLEMDFSPPYESRHVQPGTYYIIGRIGPTLCYVGPPEESNPLEHRDIIEIETPKIKIKII